jgi:hypothetical protein
VGISDIAISLRAVVNFLEDALFFNLLAINEKFSLFEPKLQGFGTNSILTNFPMLDFSRLWQK